MDCLQEELEALSYIFPELVHNDDQITLQFDHGFVINIGLPEDYPNSYPAITVAVPWIPREEEKQLQQGSLQDVVLGSPMIYEICQYIRDKVPEPPDMPIEESLLFSQIIETDNKEIAFNRNGEMTPEELNQKLMSKVIRTEKISDKKSYCQGFATRISTQQEAELYINAIKTIPELLTSRNIVAFYCNDGTTWYDDGGESGAGSVVMDMIVDANGVGSLLFIARWYDGKKEGSGRVNTIKTVASRLLQDLGHESIKKRTRPRKN